MITTSKLTAFIALAIAFAGIAPLFPWLENFPRLVVLLGFLLGGLQELRGRWKLKNWQFNLALVPVFLWYLLQYSRNNPVQPVVSMVAIMLAARICGEKSIRNLMQVNLLALVCLASRSLFDLSSTFLIWLGLLLILIPVSLVLLTFHAQNASMVLQRRQLTKVMTVALLMTAVTLPAMAFLFPVLPRTAFPLWNFLNPSPLGPTGISDRVEPGITPNAATTRTLAFRAEMPRQPQPPYWRGTVFNQIHGNRWSRDTEVPEESSVLSGPKVSQIIYPEPSSSRILVSLDAPVELVLPRVRMAPDLVYETSRSFSKRISYRATSVTSGLLRTRKAIYRDFYLAVPSELPQQLLQLAAHIRQQGKTDAERLALTEQHFLNGGYRYSRQGLPTGKDALYQFLFVTKQGHCEFFASSFALLLRAAGVPTRIVGGYLGGEYNELGGYYLVTEDRAHVWVEVYLEGKGWLRADPSRFATNAGAFWNEPVKKSLSEQFRLLVDALDYRWNQTVVSYDFERQVDQLRMAGKQLRLVEKKMTVKNMLRLLLLVTAGIVSVLALLRLLPFWRIGQHERLVRRFKKVLKKQYGVEIDLENTGLFEVAAILKNPLVDRFVSVYAEAVYRDKRLSPDEIRRLSRLLDTLQHQQRP